MAQPVNSPDRLERIEQFLRERRYADLHTLADEFGISLSTVRRALNDLEAAGTVRRHHGGAMFVDEESSAPGGYDFITQDNRYSAEKHALARRIAAEVEPGMTVMIDGGTTTYTVARMLVDKRIIVITNSLPIAALFNDVGTTETIVTGGTVYPRLGVLYGPTCEQALSQMHADLVVLGCAGITEEGFWNTNSFIVAYQRRMIAAADRAIWACDASKLDRRALVLACGFTDRTFLVTAGEPPPPIQRSLEDAGGRWASVDASAEAEGDPVL